ncbi:unnamed protein product [Orchesella dallaii]|uniref:Uncharacterized protein n=1 Tax=Orchesella dallaii TaxID=48710 RepID=A0ABP1QTZ8_9HEXA
MAALYKRNLIRKPTLFNRMAESDILQAWETIVSTFIRVPFEDILRFFNLCLNIPTRLSRMQGKGMQKIDKVDIALSLKYCTTDLEAAQVSLPQLIIPPTLEPSLAISHDTPLAMDKNLREVTEHNEFSIEVTAAGALLCQV